MLIQGKQMAQFVRNLSDIIDFKFLLQNLNEGYLECDSSVLDENGKIKEEFQDDIRAVKLVESGYKEPFCTGKIYTARYHFSEDIVDKLDTYFGTACVRMLVSEFKPGHIAPPHFDYLREGDPDAEKKLLEYGDVEAYHIHVGDPEEGHLFLVENQCYYYEKEGNCYKWDNHLSWHCACNTGYGTKYLITYAGIKLHDKTLKYQYQFHQDTEQVNLIFEDGTTI